MKKTALVVSVLLVVFVLGLWVSGTKIIVVQPIGAIPDGVTVLVTGISGPNFVDSPDAICQRTQGGVSLLCRGITAAAIAKKGNIIARLPYSSFLYGLTGAPDTPRARLPAVLQ